MADRLFDPGARKREVRLSINGDLYSKAQAAGVDTTGVAEAAIARALHQANREQLLADIRTDMEVVDRFIAEHGDPVAELREMFGTL